MYRTNRDKVPYEVRNTEKEIPDTEGGPIHGILPLVEQTEQMKSKNGGRTRTVFIHESFTRTTYSVWYSCPSLVSYFYGVRKFTCLY